MSVTELNLLVVVVAILGDSALERLIWRLFVLDFLGRVKRLDVIFLELLEGFLRIQRVFCEIGMDLTVKKYGELEDLFIGKWHFNDKLVLLVDLFGLR